MNSGQRNEGLPLTYSAAEVAEALDCSEWWVKEQARRGRIPFTKPGGSYRFTVEHFVEIMRIFESRPTEVRVATARATPAPRRQVVAIATVSATPLKARTPRRAQQHQSQNAA